MVSRRRVLRAGAAAALGSAAGLAGQAMLPGPSWAGVDDCDWAALTGALSPGATVYRPGQASYQPLSVPFNHRYADIRPAGILVPETVGDVRAAVRWARARGIPLVPRSGVGHNYAGYSTTTGLLLLMSRMRDITVRAASPAPAGQRYGPVQVSPDAGLLTVAAGVTNADLHPLLTADGILVPAGRCPSVGVAGLVLGGGIGFSDKMFGLTCDRLVATTVVLADGSAVTCDEATNPDLFWACRGGAGNNFGVNTSFTFRYEQVRGAVTFYRFRWRVGAAVPAMTALQAIAQEQVADRRFDCRFGIGTSGLTPAEIRDNARVDAIGQFYGSADELARIVQPALQVGTPDEQRSNRDSIREVTPARSAALLGATTPRDQFAAKSAVLIAPLRPDQVHTVVARLMEWPGSRNPDGAGIALFGIGGRVNEVPAAATAFVHRDGLFVFAAEAAWADDDPPALGTANLDWLGRLYPAVFGADPPRHAYQNFPDPELVDWQHAYYGANYARLRTVKDEYDPTGFFRYDQGIGSGCPDRPAVPQPHASRKAPTAVPV